MTGAGLAAYFEETVEAGADPKVARNWLLGAVRAKVNEAGRGDPAWLRERLAPARLAGLLVLVAKGTISGSMAKDVFEKMIATGRPADEIVSAEGLAQIDDDAQILGLIAAVLEKNGDAVAQYPIGQDQRPRLPRRTGDEGDGRKGEPVARQRAAQALPGIVIHSTPSHFKVSSDRDL